MVQDDLKAQINLIEANSEIAALKDKDKDIRNELVRLETKKSEQALHARQLRQAAKDLAKHAQAIQSQATDEEREILGELINAEDADTTLEAEITSLEQRLELVANGDPRVIEEFRLRGIRIEEIKRGVGEKQEELESLNEEIKTIRARWEPCLDKLVKRISDAFSYNFDQIMCSGQVSISKDEDDFANWAILIEVKFRYVSKRHSPAAY